MKKVKSEDGNKEIGTSNSVRILQFVSGLSGFFKSLANRRSQAGGFEPAKPVDCHFELRFFDTPSTQSKQSEPTSKNMDGTESSKTQRAEPFYLP
ncbi:MULTISPECIES: hypothetical protein [unclassified Ruegeria]|uniref:hypothetical protein n=1 Tax=unclassified Ruegeria TaxID=2625375 RepID=UPI0014899EC5|nr:MULTISPECIES: hypothetical protein [unclassified Ruegeria]